MASKRVKDGPHWVKAWISELSALTDQFRDIETGAVDFEALGREEYHFRMALSRRDFSNSERARKVWEDAVGNYQQRIKAASKDKKNQDTTADGDVREDSHDGKSGTSANLYGDAATSDGAEDCRHHSNVSIAHPTTVSKNMRRVPQNEAPAHGFSGGRTAQGTMSRSPEAAAQSGKAYDQETIEISANGRRTGGPSLSQTSSLPPVRQSEPDVMSLAYSGEFGNVRLTQEQYAELGIKFGNQQKLNRAIDSLSCKLENGETNPRNHYAELVKWANYRDDMDEKEELKASSAPHYETVSEHNARVVAEGKKWIDAHFPRKDKKNG